MYVGGLHNRGPVLGVSLTYCFPYLVSSDCEAVPMNKSTAVFMLYSQVSANEILTDQPSLSAGETVWMSLS